MSTEAAYSIADLARLTGVNVRTIRYYLAQGLLPASGESGPGAHYGDGHLNRLLLTRRLQEQHLPLAEIRRRLAELTDLEIATLVAAPAETERASTSSALDYVRTVLGAATASGRQPGANLAGAWPAPAPVAMPTSAGAPSLLRRAVDASRFIVAEAPAMPGLRDEPAGGAAAAPGPAATRGSATAGPAATPGPAAASRPTAAPEPPGPERSQWERLALGPNVEIHIRRPLSRLEQRRVERLITIARQVLKEDNQ